MPHRPWRTYRLPALVSHKGACEILNVQKMTLNRWQRPGSGTHGPEKTYMIPPVRLDDGKGQPVWVKSDVERFRDEIGRQRAPAQMD